MLEKRLDLTKNAMPWVSYLNEPNPITLTVNTYKHKYIHTYIDGEHPSESLGHVQHRQNDIVHVAKTRRLALLRVMPGRR